MHCMTWYTSTCGIMAKGLLYRLDSLVKCTCACVSLESHGFYDRHNHFQMIGHYKMYITSSVGHPMLDLVGLLVVDGRVQWLRHQHCITSPSR